jgi:hypothetical protein
MNALRLSLIPTLLLAAACGGGSSGGEGVIQRQELEPGNYRAVIRPMNTTQSFIVSGMANFSVTDSTFSAQIVMDDAPAARHIQTLHAGANCPQTQDLNGDGLVDVNEARLVLGDPILTLDSDLSRPGAGTFPSGRSYTYRGQARFAQMSELVGSLENHVVLIHGVHPSSELPGSVGTLEGLAAHETLPIACGVIQRVD